MCNDLKVYILALYLKQHGWFYNHSINNNVMSSDKFFSSKHAATKMLANSHLSPLMVRVWGL